MPTTGELAAGLLSKALAGYDIVLSQDTSASFALYADMLVEWNSTRFNLTRLVSPEQIALNHFLDSLAVTRFAKIPYSATVIDIGTGPGFPGLALKIFRPDITLVLIESTSKKLSFCRAVAEAVSADRVEFVHGRAEEPQIVKRYGESGSLVTARAVAQMNVLLGWAVPYIAPQGSFIAWKGSRVFEELAEAQSDARRFEVKLQVKEQILTVDGVEPVTHYYVVCNPYRQ